MLNWSVDRADLPVFANLNGGPFSVLIGWVAELARDRNVLKAFAGFVAGSTVPFVFGPHYVTVGLGLDSGPAVIVAGTLFIPRGVIKFVIAAVIIPLAWRAVRRLGGKNLHRGSFATEVWSRRVDATWCQG